MPAATAALSDSASPRIGTATRRCGRAAHAPRGPCASLPTTSSTAPSPRGAAPAGSPSAAASSTRASAVPLQPTSSSKDASTTAWRKWEPMAERSTFGPRTSAVPSRATVATAPSACAVRIIVPTLPGSCTASSTSSTAPFAGRASDASVRGSQRATASTPLGVSVSATASKSRRGTVCTGTPAAATAPSRASSATSSPSSVAPARRASSTSRRPSSSTRSRRSRALRRWRSRTSLRMLRASELAMRPARYAFVAAFAALPLRADCGTSSVCR